uniref:disease resistance protein RPV1-like n=1 Tax=Erigeron canadensis TaxID=72917 RepID=UPI001CB91322|nr:disease resistance protein RPV1-like [Erigeron canadensis]
MACTSSSSSVLNITHHKYDVFLSFRGEDTRHAFTDHLYDAFLRAGLRTFRDNDAIDRGQPLEPEIKKAILESRSSIIVLSENYANSRWCLEELVLILEQRRNSNHFVLPVFYHVIPSHVRKQSHSFAIEYEHRDMNDVNCWKSALREVANLTGMTVSGSETKLIQDIIRTVHDKLDLKQLSTPAHLTGMETRAKHINFWLRTDRPSAEALAICGMGGIGKTTLAQYIYNSNKLNFESSSFLMEIGKHNKQPNGLLGLQKQLLADISGLKNDTSFSRPELTRKIEDAMQVKKVLIVLDDIDDKDQIGALVGTKTLHTKIKIIITTRSLDIRTWFGSISCKCKVYKLKLLNDHESLELLSFHAFGSTVPLEEFKDLAVQLAQYCAGNPLALKVLGSSLTVSAGDVERSRNHWISRIRFIKSSKGDLHNNILGILKTSYDSLPHFRDRELFLHIAFFFVGEYEDDVVQILEHDWHARAGINVLNDRCLLTISPSKKLMMHQLLQEMGRTIVKEESKDPAKRSRVCQDDSYHVLVKGEGSQTIEGLALDMRNIDQGMASEALQTDSFANMDKLKFLQLKYVELTGSYKSFPELTWLCWHACHLKTIPSDLLMGSLVAIDLSYGKLEEFEIPEVLNSLKTLNFRNCLYLASIRNLNRVPNLETLILWDCTSLTHISKTIAGLERLALLDLTGCKNLLKVTEQQSFILPHSLQFLFLNNVDLEKLNNFHVVFSGQPFFYINLGNNLFNFLPNNIDLKMLRVLNLTSCRCLKSLLYLPRTLEELYTHSCESLKKITFQSAHFKLREFGYSRCIELCEIQGLFKLVFIKNIGEAELGHMNWIRAFQDHTVELVGDEIIKGRQEHIQMLYEYGIMSTYLWQEEDEINQIIMPEYTSASPFLSFQVPFCPKIQGLNVYCGYYSLLENEDQDECVLFAKVSNINKGLTWIYNPVVFCKARTDRDALWLSYWPIGNLLEPGDEVQVSIVVGNNLIVSRCSAGLVYVDCEFTGEKDSEKIAKGEEVIGGDLSQFELTKGVYYLCRRDLLKSMSPDWLTFLVGGTVNFKKLQGWKKCRQSHDLAVSFTELSTFRGRGTLNKVKIVLRVIFGTDSQKKKVLRAISTISGVESIDYDVQIWILTIIGQMDPIAVVLQVRELGNFAELLVVEPC